MGFGYTGPNGEDYHKYSEVICKKYGFDLYKMIFADAALSERNIFGGWDLHKLLTWVMDEPSYPAGITLAINLEGKNWKPWDEKGNVNPQLVADHVRLIEAIRMQRPDVMLGYYLVAPIEPREYYCTADKQAIEIAAKINAGLKPIIDAADYVSPSMYVIRDGFDLANQLWYERKVIEACKKNYPGKPIIPFMWPQWADVRALQYEQAVKDGFKDGTKTQGFKFTEEQIAAANVPGKIWRALIEQLKARDIESFIVWGEGYFPWDEKHDWVQESLEWRDN
jgi:hypothetical protein